MFIQSNSIQTIKENIMTYFNGTLQELNGNGHYIANDNGDTIQVHFNDYSLFIIITLTGQY
jgi:hypothetical protein